MCKPRTEEAPDRHTSIKNVEEPCIHETCLIREVLPHSHPQKVPTKQPSLSFFTSCWEQIHRKIQTPCAHWKVFCCNSTNSFMSLVLLVTRARNHSPRDPGAENISPALKPSCSSSSVKVTSPTVTDMLYSPAPFSAKKQAASPLQQNPPCDRLGWIVLEWRGGSASVVIWLVEQSLSLWCGVGRWDI